ncbi:MAG: hypothetical protein QXE46_01635 [Candidatus Thermoplasmatota archaeon]
MVEKHGLKYIAPMEKTNRIKKLMEYRDAKPFCYFNYAENNFMVKTKTADFIIRYFFFLFISLLYNLWYFIRVDYSITAEEWKDLIEDEFIVGKCIGNYARHDNSIEIILLFFLLQLQDYLMLLFFKI